MNLELAGRKAPAGTPDISVVTPSFNQGRYLQQTLESVATQHDISVEHIVVDGGSSDSSIDIIESYRHRLGHVIVEPDGGQADALCKGFALTRGAILCYLNSDDILLPGALQKVASFFKQNPQVDAVYSNRLFINDAGDPTGVWILPPHSNYCMSRWDFIPQETCFWRRSLMERAGAVNPEYQFAMDYDLFVRMMKVGNFRHIQDFFAAFRVHPSAKSSTLYETVGRREVALVQHRHAIDLSWRHTPLKYLFGGSILSVSWLYRWLRLPLVQKRLTSPR